MTSLSSPDDEAVRLAGAIQALCDQRADQILAQRGMTVRSFDVMGPQKNRRLSALARLQALEEVITMLRDSTGFQVELAVINKATYAEVGAACGISRQAARKRYEQRVELQNQRREQLNSRRSTDYDDDYESDPWPPRSWRFRAPNGYRTIKLIDGPAGSQEYRTAVGDDAFVHIGYRNVFGSSFSCWARYSPRSPDDVNYYFTNEYYLR